MGERGPVGGEQSGALLFARYAYPPNEMGYCGPDAAAELLERVAGGGGDEAGLRAQARGFEGAWPYLELIAAANRVADPLDRRVVEAYWVGNRLLDAVTPVLVGRMVEDRFRARAGPVWTRMVEVLTDVPGGGVPGPGERGDAVLRAVPHHSFHVFAVYPWLGLLREGRLGEPLRVLDRCRIRWGQVLEVGPDHAVVLSRPLEWVDGAIREGAARPERVVTRREGRALVADVAPGDWCSLHWDWVCARLDRRRLTSLRTWSAAQLALVNGVPHPAPAAVLS